MPAECAYTIFHCVRKNYKNMKHVYTDSMSNCNGVESRTLYVTELEKICIIKGFTVSNVCL